ncbi:MAG TPA: hypothetical protein PK286_00330 [Devosia sp.]|nr:hypothetical protein [Devosia sp.]
MIKLNVSRHLVRAAAVALVLVPVSGAGLVLPANAAEKDKCEGSLFACLVKEAEEGSAKLTAAPTKAPVAGESLSTPLD